MAFAGDFLRLGLLFFFAFDIGRKLFGLFYAKRALNESVDFGRLLFFGVRLLARAFFFCDFLSFVFLSLFLNPFFGPGSLRRFLGFLNGLAFLYRLGFLNGLGAFRLALAQAFVQHRKKAGLARGSVL